jgi:hypothetical protein
MNASSSYAFSGENSPKVDLSPCGTVENSPGLFSRAGFLRMVGALADESIPSKPPIDFKNGDMESVFVSCPYFTWIQLFGEPRNVEQRAVEVGKSAIHAWEQVCGDGSVHCVGHFVGDPDVGHTIILTRVCNF